MIHFLALYGSATLIAALFVGVLVSFDGLAKEYDHRSDHELCVEVAEEVQRSVEAGLISQFDADQIVERCFNTFARDDK